MTNQQGSNYISVEKKIDIKDQIYDNISSSNLTYILSDDNSKPIKLIKQ